MRHIRATDPAVGGALVQHHHWTGKNCPARLRAGEQGGWSAFLDLVAGAAPVAKPTPAPPKTPAPAPAGRTVAQMADEVIRGRHGSGHAARQASLGADNVTYALVRAEVNRRLTGRPGPTATPAPAPAPARSIAQMADEVIRGRHGSGHAARQRSLGVDNATYAAVRAEVNRRLR